MLCTLVIHQGSGNTKPNLCDWVPFHSGQVRNFYACPWTRTNVLRKIVHFCISYFDKELQALMLHSKQCGSWSAGSFRSQLIWIYTVYKIVDIFFILFSKELNGIYCLSTVGYNPICSFGQVKFSLDKLYIMAIRLSLCKYNFLANLSGRPIGELIVYQWLRHLSSVRQHFQISSPLKPLSQLNSNFTDFQRLLWMGKLKFVQMVLVTWPRWPPRPYMVKL